MSSVKKEIILRFTGFYVLVALIMVFILISAGNTIFKDGDFWRAQGAKSKIDSIIIKANRGNILAHDGKLLATSVPSYHLAMDFKADGFKKDTFFKYLDFISDTLVGLIYTDKTKEEMKAHLLRGYEKRNDKKSDARDYYLGRRRVFYSEHRQLQKLPFFNKGPNRSGLIAHDLAKRKWPFKPLALRTIGDVYGKDKEGGGQFGLEMHYDSLLRGINGTRSKQKMAGTYSFINVVEPVDGPNLRTTLDINMQDIVTNALQRKLEQVNAAGGCAVVMEVKTGEIKAIANLERTSAGYAETQNLAVSSETEPGSTFKIASMMVALDDGVIDTSYVVNTGRGVWQVKKGEMRDHNWKTGGFGKITAAQAMWNSSNVGVSKIIYTFYKNKPEKFVEGLYRMKLNEPLDLEIPGSGKPMIKHPHHANSRWSGTSLPWMSIGYETKIPPIYMLTFYNAIANDGVMVKPMFVKSVNRADEEIRQFSTEVIHPAICKSPTLRKIRQLLIDVVEKGTGTPARSPNLRIAGKTGTAQVDYGKKGARLSHQLTFCGYFPAEAPMYSCIVVVWSPDPAKAAPSGGGICGPVFKNIAERIYAQSPLMQSDLKMACDTTAIQTPVTKDGRRKELQLALTKLNIPNNFQGAKDDEWVFSEAKRGNIDMRPQKMRDGVAPNVIGMGAKDAVYLLENKGLKVRLVGRGKVVYQSLAQGEKIRKGDVIRLELK